MAATVVENDTLYEREIDFVVANAKKGILCIEAKNGSNISFDGRSWRYSSGRPMEKGGPYHQIATAKRAIISKIECHPNEEVQKLIGRCKVMHAVFFFKVAQVDYDKIVQRGLPEDADPRITLLAEDMLNPTKKIADIFSLKLPSQTRYSAEETKLSDEEFQLLLDTVLCPAFNLIPSPSAKNIMMENQMNQLLNEQFRLLDFLEEQNSAVINGAAGTGKTMIACEKARRNSINGERVLFLCYNRLLCDYLVEHYKQNEKKSFRAQYKNVDFMTISKLAKEVTGNYKDFEGLKTWIENCYGDIEKFGYKHVIIDEGQDFGLVDIKAGTTKEAAKNNCSIIDTLRDVVVDGGGSFYLFYDKYQMIQGGSGIDYELPTCITDSDCRLTLYRNCRNTKEIARTSVTTLKDKRNKAIKPTVACSWFEPAKPVMHLVKDDEQSIAAVDDILRKYKDEGIDNVIILTSNTFEYCCLADFLEQESDSNGSYYLYDHGEGQYKTTTCIRFKGLEADAIIMVDLDKNSFVGKKALEFYVGTSRAKLRLDLVCKLAEDEYFEVIHELEPNAPQKNDVDRMRKILGSTFSADVKIG